MPHTSRTALKLSTAVLAAVLAVAFAPPAISADLDPHLGPYGYAPDDDPRYADVYRHPLPAPRPRPYAAPAYRAPPPYAYRPPAPRAAYGCVPREVVLDDLARKGWYGLHKFEIGGDVVHLRARRPNGAVFELTLDRCSGQLIERRFVAAPPPTYAWRERSTPYRPYD